MPKPKPNETQDEFISRCIPMVISEGTTDDPAQAAAICHSKWREGFSAPQYSSALPLYECAGTDDGAGVKLISLVSRPAIGVGFMMFSAEERTTPLAFFHDEEMLVTGPAIIPGLRIYRRDDKRGEYDVFFSKETVKLLSQRYLMESRQSNASIEHGDSIDATTLVESWLVRDPGNDKAASMGFSVPDGTWMVTMKVTDPAVWGMLKESGVTGFSIEGMFALDQVDPDDVALANIIDILSKVKD